jgi:predicted RNA-binding Zn-ribbon protein involved in translation (DUF1610 family)
MTDVTDKVAFTDPDGETLPLTKCVCGKLFEAWQFLVSYEADTSDECPDCGRVLIFRQTITVYEVNKHEPT